jgi:hypothetical protein
VKAARLLAGGVSIHATASAAGMSYLHLVAVEHGEQPVLPSDATDLSRVLDVPAQWLLELSEPDPGKLVRQWTTAGQLHVEGRATCGTFWR